MARISWIVLAAIVTLSAGLTTAAAPDIDGTVDGAEYAFSYHNNEIGMSLSWSVLEGVIYLAMRAPATGWVGLNFMPMDGTIHGDTVIGYVDGISKTLSLSDQVAPGDGHFPHFEDSQHGGSTSFLETAGSEREGETTIEFSRKLMTGEPTDAMFMDRGLMTMISFHPSADDYVSYHGGFYSVVTINYLTGHVNDFPTDLSHVEGEAHDH